ncbi:MAG: hypothetical protein LBM19_00395 [Holosporales bacterium]|jgi:MtN3 and saliva related transmembrane protein|nr:hypothetical protein [Holosporales bacterium]
MTAVTTVISAISQVYESYLTTEWVFGTIASITTVIGIIPQVYKSYKIKSMRDVSMTMLINYFICSVSWLIYGYCADAKFVMWSNVICTATSIICIMQKCKYDKIDKR